MRVHFILLLGYRIRVLDFELENSSSLVSILWKKTDLNRWMGTDVTAAEINGLKLIDVRITGFTYPMAYHFWSNLFFYL
jgi:hypothetical protein